MHPGQQGGVAGRRRGDLLGAQSPPDKLDHRRGVDVLVSVDPTDESSASQV